jgi:hypothetical protein
MLVYFITQLTGCLTGVGGLGYAAGNGKQQTQTIGTQASLQRGLQVPALRSYARREDPQVGSRGAHTA